MGAKLPLASGSVFILREWGRKCHWQASLFWERCLCECSLPGMLSPRKDLWGTLISNGVDPLISMEDQKNFKNFIPTEKLPAGNSSDRGRVKRGKNDSEGHGCRGLG